MVKVWSSLSSRVLKDQKLLKSQDLMEPLCRVASMHVSATLGSMTTNFDLTTFKLILVTNNLLGFF